MPIITIQALALGHDRRAEVARVFTEEYSRISGALAEKITVLFQDLPVDNISTGGALLSDLRRSRCQTCRAADGAFPRPLPIIIYRAPFVAAETSHEPGRRQQDETRERWTQQGTSCRS